MIYDLEYPDIAVFFFKKAISYKCSYMGMEIDSFIMVEENATLPEIYERLYWERMNNPYMGYAYLPEVFEFHLKDLFMSHERLLML